MDEAILSAVLEDPEEIDRLADLSYSYCLACGAELMFTDMTFTVDQDYVNFHCSVCKHDATTVDYMSNLTCTEPLACIDCGKELIFWETVCNGCNREFNDQDYYEYFLFMMSIGDYSPMRPNVDNFLILKEHLGEKSFRKKFEDTIDKLKTLCFTCYTPAKNCDCEVGDYFSVNSIAFMSMKELDQFFYIPATDISPDKLLESCHNCSKAASSGCEMLPFQLTTLDKFDHPQYKLDTCEYHSPVYKDFDLHDLEQLHTYGYY